MILTTSQERKKLRFRKAALALTGMIVVLLSSPRGALVQGKTRHSPRGMPSESREALENGTELRAGRKPFRLREGTRIESRLGRFEQKSQSATFRTEDGLELGSLPNLNLQRVLETLKTADKPETMWWSVSGTVTEFAGKNYLLISRAVYKATLDVPANRHAAP